MLPIPLAAMAFAAVAVAYAVANPKRHLVLFGMGLFLLLSWFSFTLETHWISRGVPAFAADGSLLRDSKGNILYPIQSVHQQVEETRFLFVMPSLGLTLILSSLFLLGVRPPK